MEFTKHFLYLGYFKSYNLKDDYDISKRISKAFQNMGMLKYVWEDPHIDLYSKYLFFVAMPLNLLLWGCESWALKKTSYNDLNVFLHQSIRRIIGISMMQVTDKRMSIEKLRKLFYNIPDACTLIAVKQLNFIGKVVRREDSFFPKQLLTAWVNHKRKRGGVLTTDRKSVVTALGLLYPDTVWRKDENGALCKDAKGKKIPETIYRAVSDHSNIGLRM